MSWTKSERPKPGEVLQRLMERSANLSEEQLKVAGLDVLDFIIQTLDGGGVFYSQVPGEMPMEISWTIPGLTVDGM